MKITCISGPNGGQIIYLINYIPTLDLLKVIEGEVRQTKYVIHKLIFGRQAIYIACPPWMKPHDAIGQVFDSYVDTMERLEESGSHADLCQYRVYVEFD